MKRLSFGIIAAATAISACSSSYEIQVVDGIPREVYLTFSRGDDVNVGDIFVLYRQQLPPPSSGHEGHGAGGRPNLKREIGRVRVVRIVDEERATVEVLSGQVETGMQAEKMK